LVVVPVLEVVPPVVVTPPEQLEGGATHLVVERSQYQPP
jgi:hypothetical protein